MIYLGIGSNLPSTYGNRFNNINFAVKYLEAYRIQVLKKSSYYETPSYPNQNNPKFINIVVCVKTNLSPENLIEAIIDTEKKLERKRGVKNDPRTCDIDIIDYKSQILTIKHLENDFVVPHHKLTSRNFVLLPLKEIEPKWRHPISNESVDDLINKLNDNDKKCILKIKKT